MIGEDSMPPVELARVIMEDYLGQAVVSAQIRCLTGGSVNHVYSYDEKFVIRIGSGERAYLTFEKECWCMNRATEVGVATPEVYLVQQSGSWAVMIQQQINGPTDSDAQTPHAQIWRELGCYARLLNSVSLPGFGKQFLQASHSATNSWAEWVKKESSDLERRQRFWRKFFSMQEIQKFHSRINDLANLDFAPVLCHANMGVNNIVFDQQGTGFLIDWGDAGGYADFWDLAEIAAWRIPGHPNIRHFCQGYGLNEGDFQLRQPEIIRMQTWRWLSSIAWAKDQFADWKSMQVVQLSFAKLRDSVNQA